VFLRVSLAHHLKGRGPSVPKICCHHLPTPKLFDLERLNLVRKHIWGGACFLRVSPAPSQGDVAPCVRLFLEPPICARTVWKQRNFAWSYWMWGTFLRGWPQMLTRDLFAVADLLVITVCSQYIVYVMLIFLPH